MITGIHDRTWQNLQLNAGVFLKNFDFSGVSTVGELKTLIADAMLDEDHIMGATRGGGSFQCKPMLRSVEADGLRTACRGSTVNDGWSVRMTGTLLEITPSNFGCALGMVETSKNGKAIILQPREKLNESDFLPTLCWVGDTSRGFMLIELLNALNVKGAQFSFQDKGEGALPFEFQAYTADVNDANAPCRIVFLEEEAA